MVCCIAMHASLRKELLASAGFGSSNFWRLAEARCAKRMIFLIGCCRIAMILVYSLRKPILRMAISWVISRRRLLTLGSLARRLRWRKRNGANRILPNKQARIPRLLAGRLAYELVKLAIVGFPGDDCAHHYQRWYAGARIDADEL